MRQRLRDRLQVYREKDRAVSPVIGVILMVAITVILAAVIGAFVLGIGDQQANPPKATLDLQQEEAVPITMFNQTPEDNRQFRFTRTGGCYADTGSSDPNYVSDKQYNIPTEVTATHAGGDALQMTNIRVRIEATNGTDTTGDDLVAGGLTFQEQVGDVRKTSECYAWSATWGFLSQHQSITEFGTEDAPVLTRSAKWHPRNDTKIEANSEMTVSHWLAEDIENVSTGDGTTDAYGDLTQNDPGHKFASYPVDSDAILEEDRQCMVMYDNSTSDITVGAPIIHGEDNLDDDDGPTGPYGQEAFAAQNIIAYNRTPYEYDCPLRYEDQYQDVGDDISGALVEDDAVKVIWNPVESDQTQVLAEKQVE